MYTSQKLPLKSMDKITKTIEEHGDKAPIFVLAVGNADCDHYWNTDPETKVRVERKNGRIQDIHGIQYTCEDCGRTEFHVKAASDVPNEPDTKSPTS